MKNKNSKKKPFFASFLEKQLKEPKNVKGGAGITIPARDSVTKPLYDMAQTQKYPSDGDDDVQSI
ncbi:hypothetical protein HNP38_001253 [Chryseobacterium defluvii]|uniref:Serine endopeptidase inhibitor I10-like protein n=1 Tax=Chryseobacterium defluvii TaxID=160396 RepID=A0A840K936_9FLAO|nr:microviridin/marinostatin family tricyclic proteinase inhibitor [Chryseobacterium defluvii]MBB4805981.1 hypothetical protein [Chryseobacterium defluvii]